MKIPLTLLAISLFWVKALAVDRVTFKAEDGLEVVADLYMIHDKSAPFIILFHQANGSRGEYAEIAPALNVMGYNCLAVDQRSGGQVNGVVNITKQNAVKAMKGTQYLDAYLDMKAALVYVRENLSVKKVLICGSSYSAALALCLTGERPEEIDAVIAFSPGEYFSKIRSGSFVRESAARIRGGAVFITSAKNEKQAWWEIYESIPSDKKHYYVPTTLGNHGAKALWKKFPDARGYWEALKEFLLTV